METKIIYSEQEWINFYHYSPKYKPDNNPKKYPCIIRKEWVDGGLMGDHVAHSVCYLPANLKTEKDFFLAGINAEWEPIWNS